MFFSLPCKQHCWLLRLFSASLNILIVSVFPPFIYLLTWMQDHAPGSLLVTEAGCTITDSRGKFLDFGLGRDLGENFGVIAARKEAHHQVLAAVKQAVEEKAPKVNE